nr:uncharacterized protein LOC109759855 [Aegilops tauschii subsp. strangulata]
MEAGGQEEGDREAAGALDSAGQREGQGSGSDSLLWCKEGPRGSGRKGLSEEEKGEEVTSPSKTKTNEKKGGTPRQLLLGDDTGCVEKPKGEAGGEMGGAEGIDLEKPKAMKSRGANGKENQEEGHNKQSRKFKRVRREDRGTGEAKASDFVLGGKRGRSEEMDDKEDKKGKVGMEVEERQESVDKQELDNNTSTSAGLQEQPRRAH